LKYFILIPLLIISIRLYGQNLNTVELIIQEILESQHVNGNQLDILYDQLIDLSQQPLNLNLASPEELKKLFFLDQLQLNRLIEYRIKYGTIYTLYELKLVDGFDLITIGRLLPFIILIEGSSVPRYKPRTKGYLMSRIEKANGSARDTLYEGNNIKMMHRIKLEKQNKYKAGLILEKDAGEGIGFSRSHHPFDHQAGYLMLENKNVFKRILVGHFQAHFGQGLVIGSGFSSGKSSQTTNVGQNSTRGIDPYSSATEFGYLQGSAIEIQQGKFSISGMISDQTHDAQIISTDSGEIFQTIQKTGLHRTTSEIEAKSSVKEYTLAVNSSYHWKDFCSFGVNFLKYKYNITQIPKDELYLKHNFTGKTNFVGSVFTDLTFRNSRIFGELARSASGGMAFVGGLSVIQGDLFQLSVLHRSYAVDFQNKYAKSFAENSQIANEKGFYLGIKWSPIANFQLSSYLDYFKFPWLKYRVDFPSEGKDFLLRGEYSRKKEWSVYFQYKYDQSMLNASSEKGPLKRANIQERQNFIVNCNYLIDQSFSFQSRIQGSWNPGDHGILFAQDLNYQAGPLKLSGRVSLFEVSDFSARQYLYERDVLYAFSIPAFQDYGMRRYLMISYKLKRYLQFWVRASQTTKFQYYNEIDPDHKNPINLKFQTRVNF